MYFVDRKKIEQNLVYLEFLLKHLDELSASGSSIEKLALERSAHVIIEGMMDVGNAMIDGFIMRDPGSYDDILDILEDEKVITTSDAKGLKQVISLRKMLVQEFSNVDHDAIHSILAANREPLKNFPFRVRSYIEKELGPVSAFLPEDQQ
ncbi:Uncharacterized conserved protein YutE, UPF0331/DUF86 family [Fictibacillus solisalsi]|uniref:Uncharacterized conserved protein YutE, UPF0331/DUF86 family n=1 Tax=Fictibacillus solisalsi TaxID=459525 RepID=A0A1G9XH16_9BACL|nr:DUF86 domain-containing protein [Fictibacillus solisalsi]SDM95593.1 Uncharacterized conserved protein YutE, UPF0331/DUF86 family [Fictibacillus solisalsi]